MEQKVYKVEDLEGILDISRNKAYEYVRQVYEEQSPFTVIKLGRSYRIPKNSFDRWFYGDG